jgi:quercetin dioxygenase-like cupin family protein
MTAPVSRKPPARMTVAFTAVVVALIVTAAIGMRASTAAAGTATRRRAPYAHALPTMDGAHMKATSIEVTYSPGESSPPHSHPCAVNGYVTKGALRSQLRGEAQTTYVAGQGFYEAPAGAHVVSGDASKTEPVKLVVTFICGYDAPLSKALPRPPSVR